MSEQPEDAQNPQPAKPEGAVPEPVTPPITKPAPAPAAKKVPASGQERWKPSTGNLVLWIVVGGLGLYLVISGVIGALNA